jgi:aspartokinase
VFGWGRSTIELGIKEFQSGIVCLNDLSARCKPRTEEKHPKLLADIRLILDPKSQAQSHLRTALSYTNVTAKSTRAALVEKGWSEGELPSVRTMSNILNRQDYRLRRVEKSQVQKKRRGPI